MATPQTIQIMQSGEIRGALQFIGAGSVGPQINMTLDSVLITPSAALNFIHDEWGQLHLEGEPLVNISTGSFGTLTHPDSGLTSPDVTGYYIGKGVLSWKGINDIAFRDLGNCPVFEFTPEVKKLDHYSSRLGIKVKDKTVVVEKSAKVKVVLEEWTAPNLILLLMGV